MSLRQYSLSTVLLAVAVVVIHVAHYVFPQDPLARHVFLFIYLGFTVWQYRRIPLQKSRRATDRERSAVAGAQRI